ncbi:hypothetical protein KFU94_11785 [Chloroflexi bacterium TSY]|nr:hypothetical protein [Chloroflexi bacterium TSY]
MTTKHSKSKNHLGRLKTTIVVGSVVATMLGTNLIARKDSQESAMESETESFTFLTTGPSNEWPLDIASGPFESTQINILESIALKPVPTVVTPTEVGLVETASVIKQNRVLPRFESIPAVAASSSTIQPSVNMLDIDQVLSFELQQIPAAEIPPPVTRSRSSR